MSKDHDMGAGIVAMAFVMGVIGGAAAALLLGPMAGPETRRNFTDRARGGRDRAEEAARQGADFVRRQRSQLFTAIERGVEAYQRARAVESGSGAVTAEDEG